MPVNPSVNSKEISSNNNEGDPSLRTQPKGKPLKSLSVGHNGCLFLSLLSIGFSIPIFVLIIMITSKGINDIASIILPIILLLFALFFLLLGGWALANIPPCLLIYQNGLLIPKNAQRLGDKSPQFIVFENIKDIGIVKFFIERKEKLGYGADLVDKDRTHIEYECALRISTKDHKLIDLVSDEPFGRSKIRKQSSI